MHTSAHTCNTHALTSGCCSFTFLYLRLLRDVVHFQKPPLSDAANGRWGPLGAYSMVQPDGQVNQRHTSTLSVYTTIARVCVHAYVCI